MSNSSFDISSFVAVSGVLVVQDETQINFTLKSLYTVTVTIELWSADNNWAATPQNIDLDGSVHPVRECERVAVFEIPPKDMNYRLTVNGDPNETNTVGVSIDY